MSFLDKLRFWKKDEQTNESLVEDVVEENMKMKKIPKECDAVLNEVREEESTCSAPPNAFVRPNLLYKLRFTGKGKRQQVWFDKVYLCTCYPSQHEQVEKDFNTLKMQGKSTFEIRDILRDKYSSQGKKKKQEIEKKDKGKGKGNWGDDKFSFTKVSGNKRLRFNYRFDKRLEEVAKCYPSEKAMILHDTEHLLSEGKDKEEVKRFIRAKYMFLQKIPVKYTHNKHIPKGKKNIFEEIIAEEIMKIKEEDNKKDDAPILSWKEGELYLDDEGTKITPSQLNMICTLHIHHSNPFTFSDYVLQNLPNAKPSAIEYICTNYAKVDFNKLVKEGMRQCDEQRGFKGM